MKTLLFTTALMLSTVLTGFGQGYDNYSTDDNYYYSNQYNDPQDQYYDNGGNYNSDGGNYQEFYEQLSPYGSWVDYPGRGYVWIPSQGAGFTPYLTNGHWVYTDYGWTWVSGFQWGWATFHYGRWFYDDYYGWTWAPGRAWAPAWVVWGNYGDYYGWAPIGPGVIITASYRPDPHRWCFVNHNVINNENISSHVVNNTVIVNNITRINNNVTIINQSATYNNHVYFAGPKVNEVQRYTGAPVAKVAVNTVNTPNNARLVGNQVSIYRPTSLNQTANRSVAPTKLARPQDITPVNRNATMPVAPQRGTNNSVPSIRNVAPQQNNPARTVPNNTPENRNAAPNRNNYQPSNVPNQAPQRTQPSYTPPRQSTPVPTPAPRINNQSPVEQRPHERYFEPNINRQVPQQAPQQRQNFAPQQQSPRQNFAPQQAPRQNFAPQQAPRPSAPVGRPR